MIIESIALEGVRHFRNRVTISGLQPGLNVIVAPNGTGKTTIVDGLVAALVQNHKTAGIGIRDFLRHVAHDLTPIVEVTLRYGDGRFRLRKVFLKGASAKLESDEGGTFVTIADGEAVETWLENALALDRPGSGVAKPEHYGLGAILWARQSEPALGKLPAAQEQRLRSLIAPGSATLSSAESLIRDAIDEQFKRYWEPRGKNYAKGQTSANIPALQEAVDQAHTRRDRATEDHQLAIQDRSAFDDISTLLTFRETRRQEQRRRLDELKSLVDRVRTLDGELALAEQAAGGASADLARLSKERDSLIEAQGRLKLLEPQLYQLELRTAEIDENVTTAEAAIARAFEDQGHAHRENTAIAAEDARVADARSFLLATESLNALELRWTQIDRLRTLREDEFRKIAAVIAPDDDAWRDLVDARNAQREAQQRVASESLTLRFTPALDLTARVRSGWPDGEHHWPAGAEVLVNGLGAIDVEITDIGTLRVTSPMESAIKLRDALNAADEALSKHLASYGNASFEVLEVRRAERASYKEKLADFDSRLNGLLNGEDPSTLMALLESRRTEHQSLLDRYPEWASVAPDPNALAGQIEPRRNAATSALAAATATIEAQQKKKSELLTERDRVRKERDAKHTEIITYTNVVSLAEKTNLPDQISAAGLAELQAKAKVDDLRKQRSEIPGDPVGEYEGIEQSIVRLSDDIESDGKKAERLRATLEAKAGAYEALAVAEADVEATERRRNVAERDANAVKLLHDHVETASRQIAEAVNAPLSARATAFARRIMSRDDVRIGFNVDDKGMMRHSLGTSAWDKLTISDTISGGEREQIEIAMRLAMGSLLAKDEPQVVILDDALTFCDPVRLYRVLEILAEAEQENLQIILTGCDADRYASMPKGAHRIELDAMIQHAGSA